jgi:hypothetical protein
MRTTTIVSFCFVCVINISLAQSYFLCGPDEDGCTEDVYPWCLCIPHDGIVAQQKYCLNFTTLACQPLSTQPLCPPTDIFNSQSDCLATMLQSEATPACPLVDESFCREHHIQRCPADSAIGRCHRD